MASFSFSLNSGYPLILTAGGTGPSGVVFVAGRNDVVFQIEGEYSMNINNNNVTITLSNMRGLIFPDKANNSSWFYYATAWANARNNCTNIRLDVSTSRQGNGAWSDSNSHWQYACGWKGGRGGGWVKYRYNNVEASCSGSSGDGIYHGAAKAPNSMTFNLGSVDFNTTNGFWIGANLDCWDGGYEVWQWFDFPIIIFDPPTISLGTPYVNVCEKYVELDISGSSSSSFASGGGTWELQYSTDANFSNAITLVKQTSTNSVSFEDIRFAANSYYYIRLRIKVSSIRYSQWVTTTYNTNNVLPSADLVANDLTEIECYNLRHGVLVEGGLNGI